MKNAHFPPLVAIIGIVALTLAFPGGLSGQSALVDPASMEFRTDPAKSEVMVDFRLVEDTVAKDPAAVSVRATVEGVAEPLTSAWQPWEPADIPATAWLIIVDTSNPQRKATVAENAKVVQQFIRKLPPGDAFAIHGLALGLKEVTPFGTPVNEAAEKSATLKPEGEAALATLIHQSVREGLKRLDERKEPRKAVLLLSDGKDETPGGPGAILQAQELLIKNAKASQVVIHTIGYAEQQKDLAHFGQLRELSVQTGGLHVGAKLVTRALPEGTLDRFIQMMQGAGRVVVNVAALKEVSPVPAVTVEISTESAAGTPRSARITIPAKQVAAALGKPESGAAPSDPTEPTEETAETPESDEPVAEGTNESEDAEDDPKSAISPWIWLALGLVLVIGATAALKIRANKRRAEQAARIEAEREEEERLRAALAEETRRKEAVKPLAWLEMCDEKQTKTPITIPSLKIGRGRHNDLVLRNDSVSGNHCVLNRTREGEWTISDLQSGNGTMLNGTPVSQATLQHDDTIELGELRMRFLLPS